MLKNGTNTEMSVSMETSYGAAADLPVGGRPGTEQRSDVPGTGPADGRPAAFFDLDKTIIAKSSALAFSRSFYSGGLLDRRSAVRSAYTQLTFLLGRADHDQMERMREFLSRMVTGWQVDTVSDIVAETLHSIIDPLVYDEAVTLIEEHRRAGRDVIIVSASGAEIVEPIGELLGVDDVIASRLAVQGGRYTGEIQFYAYAQNKAEAMRELAGRRGYDLACSSAYSDSVTDLPMLEAVGHPHVVNPDRELRRLARERGWPVLVFERPVALRSRMRLPRGRRTAAAALVTALVVAAATAAVRVRRHLAGPLAPAA
ncbi:MAG: Phosphoserine phosphatase [uncultured Nocardioidaceae bacterium]|uniref:Phosphoserine phosphatase n=1 Tax=uncultured Nocardioidaceae bacterium TaxID=253824 RepID=A0A6J4LMR4_9ACTN|nr:MAG: Phosphoserine phosphatase [uncultured Nocardioidaceae bacterium]